MLQKGFEEGLSLLSRCWVGEAQDRFWEWATDRGQPLGQQSGQLCREALARELERLVSESGFIKALQRDPRYIPPPLLCGLSTVLGVESRPQA